MATIYKCRLDDGGVFYQDAPCAPGRELRDFDKDPATVSVVPFEQPPASAPQGPGAAAAKPSGTRKGARWTYMPVAEDPDTITNLQFDNGRLVEVERKVLR